MIIILFTDFDGTLVDLASTPDKVRVSKKVIDALSGLAKKRWARVAVVTGRSLENMKHKLPLKNIIFAGNHGLEIELCGEAVIRKAEDYKHEIDEVERNLKKLLHAIPGILIENKGVTLSLHFRMVNKKDMEILKEKTDNFFKYYLKHASLKVTHGKKVIELRPKIGWDKGKAVSFIINKIKKRAKEEVFPVYIGDDLTDEPAFKAVNAAGGISIFVGKAGQETPACYRISSPSKVIKFIQGLGGMYEKNIQS